jgi:long-chain acyl-CoA synthetase
LSARTIGEDLGATAAQRPGHEAVITADGRLTYTELDQAADRLAAGLAEAGISRGERVVTLLPNGLDAAVAIYGTLRAGAVLSPVHPAVKSEKLARLLADAGAGIVITDAERAATAKAGAAASGARVVVGVESLAGEGVPAPPSPEDLAAIIYTSGSTGEPNGVTLTHHNMTFVAGSIIEYLRIAPDDRTLCVLPLSFGYGLYQLLTTVRTGGTLVLEPGIGLPGRIVSLLEEQRITVLPGVPTLFELLIRLPGLEQRDLPHLRAVTNAGAGLALDSVAAVRRTFPGAELFSMYGQTECQRVCYLPPEQLEARPASVGIAIPGTEAWVEDEHGNRVGPDVVGELIVRGEHVMQGYWGKPEETAKKLRPGRSAAERVLATGDLFRHDDEGFLYFVSRRDDIIKSRGEKVVPREVEEVLRGAPGVREAAVVGVADKLLGEAVHAHVSPQPDAELDERALLRHCAEHLEDYMVPQRVLLHPELAKTANGKIDRRTLAAQGASPGA